MKESDDLHSIRLTLTLYIVIFVLKLAVYAVTGVMALFAEAFHTLADIIIAAFLLVAAIVSRKQPDEGHMFGHERVQNVAALVAATLFLSFTSYKLYEEAIPRLFRHDEAVYHNVGLAVAVLVLSMLIAAAPLLMLFRQKVRGPAAKAQFMELINDELGLLAALLGTLFIIWGHPLGDPLAAMAVATIIAINAIGLFRENLSYLLGRAPEPEIMATIARVASSIPGVVGVHNLRAEGIGPASVQGSMHIVVRRGIPIEEAADITEEVDRHVHDAIPHSYFVIRVDAAEPEAAPTKPAPPTPPPAEKTVQPKAQ